MFELDLQAIVQATGDADAANDSGVAAKLAGLNVKLAGLRLELAGISSVSIVSRVAANSYPPANDATSPATPALDPDRHCWPHSEAMTTAELETLLHHIARFTRRGLSFAAAERLADQLVQAQRTADTRRFCLQCQHLSGHGAGAWHCRNGQQAGVSVNGRVAYLPTDWVTALQRCDGFAL